MSALLRSKAAFVFQHILDASLPGSHSASVSATTTYDDCLDFVCAFDDEFPGAKADPNHQAASRRLRALLKRLHDDGWLDRWRLSNHDQYHPGQEPNWQYAYALPARIYQAMKTGQMTPEDAAKRWIG